MENHLKLLESIFSSSDFKLEICDPRFMEQFNDTIIDLPSEDLYYLLQTFSSLVLSRNSKEWDFIECVTMNLFRVRYIFEFGTDNLISFDSFFFQIGFVNKSTKENCYKIVKDLLGNITSKYPILMSSLLMILKENFRLVSSMKFL